MSNYWFIGDVKDPHPCIKITIDDPTSIAAVEEPALLKLIPVTEQLKTEPLSIKIELVRDSEFFHLLLHELSHAAALHDKEKSRFIGDVDTLEGQLTVAVMYNSTVYQKYVKLTLFVRRHLLKRKICTLGERFSTCTWRLKFSEMKPKGSIPLNLTREAKKSSNGSQKNWLE